MFKVSGAGSRARLTIVAGLFAVALVSGAWLLERGSRTGTFSTFQAARLFDQVFAHASADFVDSLPDSVLYRKAVSGMLYELRDPASAFLPSDRFTRLSGFTQVDSAPLGLALDVREKSLVVIAPVPGSPADRAGIQTGDELTRVDGKATEGWTVAEAIEALRGGPGSKATLLISRPGGSDSISVVLTRGAVRMNTVRQAALVGDVGYVDIAELDESTPAELSQSITGLIGRGARSVIIDLRSDASGSLSSAVKVSDLLLDAGKQIVAIKSRDPSSDRVIEDSSAQKWPALPVTILIDERSAGGAEVIAGALQDHDRALLVGRQTYGKGSDQGAFRIATDGGVTLTTARWYTPSGRAISSPGPSEDDDEQQILLLRLKRFRSDAGRGVYGAGGIVPDVFAGDTVLSYQEAALVEKLGGKVGHLYDEISSYAAELKARRAVTSPDFVVTPAMRDELWKRFSATGVKLDKFTFDQAAPFVSRILGNEIARVVYGPDGELRRRMVTDAALAKAVKLTTGVRNGQALLKRGELDRESADSVRARAK